MRFTVAVVGTSFPSLDRERALLEPIGARVLDVREDDHERALIACEQADALLVDYFLCDAATIARLPRCRVICQYGVGLDQIDVPAATAAGILVTHTPGYCVDELADHTWALILALARQVKLYDGHVHGGGWDYNVGQPLRRLRGQTLGLVGLGRVGQQVAQRARPFGMRVLAFDPVAPAAAFAECGAEAASFDDLLASSDIVSLHAPLLPETQGLMGERAFARMRPGASLVNTARGAMVDQAALVAALERGTLRGAALDVLEVEPPAPGNPLLGRADVLLTPHAGFLSLESLAAVQEQAADEIRLALVGDVPRYAVNAPQVEARRAALATRA